MPEPGEEKQTVLSEKNHAMYRRIRAIIAAGFTYRELFVLDWGSEEQRARVLAAAAMRGITLPADC